MKKKIFAGVAVLAIAVLAVVFFSSEYKFIYENEYVRYRCRS